MEKQTVRAYQKALLTTLLSVALFGCHDDSNNDSNTTVPATPTAQLRGETTLVNPVASPKTRIVSGSTIISNTSGFANGNFSVTTPVFTAEQLKNLRVEVQACSDALETITCTTLSSTVAPTEIADIVQVNLRTTLVDRLKQQQNLSLADAEKKVSFYLGLPEGTTAQDVVGLNDFNPARFVSDHLIQARANGTTLDQEINKTVATIAADPALQRAYKPLLAINPTVAFVGVELIKGALSKVAGEGAGKIMSQLGLGSEFEAKERHEQVIRELGKINSQLQQISVQLNQIQAGVEKTLSSLNDIQKKLDDGAEKQRIQLLLTQTSSLSNYVSRVQTNLFDLRNAPYLSSIKTQQDEELRLRENIRKLLEERQLLSDALKGTPASSSLIEKVVNVKFPQPVVVDNSKVIFFGPDTAKGILDVVRYYDQVNVLGYYLFMEYYNDLEKNDTSARPACPEVYSAAEVNKTRQCTLYHEIKSSRETYLPLAPQEELPVASMFMYVNQNYKKDNLPLVIYPAGDFNNTQFNSNTGTAPEVLRRLVYGSLSAAQQSEVEKFNPWQHLSFAVWRGIFVNPALTQPHKDVAAANGAPLSVFRTATGENAWWTYAASGNAWSQQSTISTSLTPSLNPAQNAKFVVTTPLKTMTDVEKYMGKVIANRYK